MLDEHVGTTTLAEPGALRSLNDEHDEHTAAARPRCHCGGVPSALRLRDQVPQRRRAGDMTASIRPRNQVPQRVRVGEL